MRFLDSGNMLVQRHTSEIPTGQYSSFVIYLSGTNAGGATLAVANMNNIRINRNGQDFVNVDIDHLVDLSDLMNGLVLNASAIGAAFTIGFHIPFAHSEEFPNVLTVADEDNVKVHWDFGALAAIVAAGVFELYGILESGEERYLPIIVQDSVALGAANAQEKRKSSINNVHDVFAFPTVAANFAKLTVERDDEVLSDAGYAAQAAWTNLKFRKEAAAIAVAQSQVAIGMRPDELLSESVYVTPLSQTGAVTIDFIYRGAQFEQDSIQTSKNIVNTRLQRNVNKKRAVGKDNEISVVTAL